MYAPVDVCVLYIGSVCDCLSCWLHSFKGERQLVKKSFSRCEASNLYKNAPACKHSLTRFCVLIYSRIPRPQAYAEDPRVQWVQEWPGQVVLCVDMIYWTAEVHEAIRLGPKGLQDYSKKLQSQVCLHHCIMYTCNTGRKGGRHCGRP